MLKLLTVARLHLPHVEEVLMVRFNQPNAWTSNPHESYVPISYEGNIVGFFKPNHAVRILEILNEDEKSRKALQMACYDLIAKTGDGHTEVNDLVQRYLAKAERPKDGVRAISQFLRDRQTELDLTDEEFVKFCNTFRLSPDELSSVLNGQELEYKHLTPLSRILGITVDELLNVWKGNA